MILTVHEYSLQYCALLLEGETSRCRFDVETSLQGFQMMMARVKTETQGGGAAVIYALSADGALFTVHGSYKAVAPPASNASRTCVTEERATGNHQMQQVPAAMHLVNLSTVQQAVFC